MHRTDPCGLNKQTKDNPSPRNVGHLAQASGYCSSITSLAVLSSTILSVFIFSPNVADTIDNAAAPSRRAGHVDGATAHDRARKAALVPLLTGALARKALPQWCVPPSATASAVTAAVVVFMMAGSVERSPGTALALLCMCGRPVLLFLALSLFPRDRASDNSGRQDRKGRRARSAVVRMRLLRALRGCRIAGRAGRGTLDAIMFHVRPGKRRFSLYNSQLEKSPRGAQRNKRQSTVRAQENQQHTVRPS